MEQVEVHVYRIPTAQPEADGTFQWDSTTMVVVEATAENGRQGLGFTYAAEAAAAVIRTHLAPCVMGRSIHQVRAVWEAMVNAVRNIGRPGVAATAISAVDIALWDLKARVADQPLYQHLGAHRSAVPVYGSGGFTTYTDEALAEQLGDWVSQGISRVKMKVGMDWGTRPELDLERVRQAREAIGHKAELFVDANGAYTPKQAISQAHRFADYGVSYFEEPVSSDHLSQLAFVRQQTLLDIAAGEYGYDPWYFRDMLAAGAVDILQADVTRCLGVTGWLMAADLAYSFSIPLSAHTAPAIHAQIGCVAPQIAHAEYFADHVRIESMLFDGLPELVDGTLRPDPDRPGLGLTFRHQAAAPWRVADDDLT